MKALLESLIPYAVLGVVTALIGVAGGWWIMSARLDRCQVNRLQDQAKIESLEAAQVESRKAIDDVNRATLRLVDDGIQRQQRAEAALSEINRAQTATRNTIARLEASRAASGDCASAMALVRAEIQ